jgi:hypothetical protein
LKMDSMMHTITKLKLAVGFIEDTTCSEKAGNEFNGDNTEGFTLPPLFSEIVDDTTESDKTYKTYDADKDNKVDPDGEI